MKNHSLKKDLQYLLISFLFFLIFFLLFMAIQYLFGPTVFCDGGSVNSNSHIVQGLNLEYQSPDNESAKVSCSTAFTSYQDGFRRRLYWYSCVKSKGIYADYKLYKQAWKPETKVMNEIKNKIKNKIDDKLHKIYLQDRVLEWIFRPSTRGGRR